MENEFGGSWTEKKIDILVKYTCAYLKIMNNQRFHLTYFDGFAGSGDIKIGNRNDYKIIEGAAKKVVGIAIPRSFDLYYFVEKDPKKRELLEYALKTIRPTNNIFVVNDDCNIKLQKMAKYLRADFNRRGLVFLDPFGMNLEWSSIEALRGTMIDLWILCPTGVGANRLLKKDRKISEAWWQRLEKFFGIKREEISNSIYLEEIKIDLFGENKTIVKTSNANNALFKLYSEKMKSIFKFTSKPYVIVNRNNSVMYHFFCASNNEKAIKISNDIVKG